MDSWLSLGLGCAKLGLLGCGSVTVKFCDAIEVVIVEEMSLLSCVLDGLRPRLLPLVSACQTESSLPCCELSCHNFPCTCGVATISLLKLACIVV
jgi:hypothetical protein